VFNCQGKEELMGKKINFQLFNSLVEEADEINGRLGFKRFFPIHSKNGKLWEFGMYDYKRKKYVLSTPTSDLNEIFNEIDTLMAEARR
tara:strand:- start:11520 stop:11783 length:264 start_codon:yes stop_codon:yes gene_type:complete